MAKKKMTKAEKQALKQKAKRDFELKTKKDKLERELDYTKVQMSEIRRKVFEQAQLINVPIIKEEWLHKWGFFERTVDWKDFYISQLRDDIYYYELHHRLMEQKHNENMDQLLDIYGEGVSKVMNAYLEARDKLIKDRSRQETRIVLTQNRRVENMESIMHILTEDRKNKMDSLNWENSKQTQLKIFRYEEAITRIAQEGDMEIRTLWVAIKSIFDKYKLRTSKKRQEYLKMKQRDLAEKNNLDKLSRRMAQLHKTIKKFRSKLNKLKVDEGVRLELEMRKATQDQLKLYMRTCIDQSNKQLETLSLISSAIIQKMTDFYGKVNDAISLVSVCRKMETEDEKLAPKLSFKPPMALFRSNQILPLFDDMEELWAKIMHVTRMKEFMSNKVHNLQKENEMLHAKLRSVLFKQYPQC